MVATLVARNAVEILAGSAFGRNLESVAEKMFSHFIYFIKECY
jgi:hypothetical protein